MDDWLLHKDIVEELPNYYSGSARNLLTIFSRIESVIERDFYILLPLKRNFLAGCLQKDEFNTEIQKSDMPLTRQAALQEKDFSTRIYNRILRVPGVKNYRLGYACSESQEDVDKITNHFQYGQKKLELKLMKELILEDLRKIQRRGVFCFESFRFSEKSLEELGEKEREEIYRGDSFIYKRTFRNNQNLRLRMNSFSVICGKVLLNES